MREDKKIKTLILVCVTIVIMAVLLFTWGLMKAKRQIQKGSEALDWFVSEETETDAETGEETDSDNWVYINESEYVDDDEEVYINQEEDIRETDSVYINSIESAGDGDKVYINSDTGYRVFLQDDAQLLGEEEERELASLMADITAYGNVMFKTTDSGVWDTASYAGEYYREKTGTESGILLLIDMDNRMIWIHSDGAVYQVITRSYANTITDNVYRYASDGDYFECASQAFGQALALLKGNRIAQPMKYISNALLAVILALLLNYGVVLLFTRIRKPGRGELLGNAGNYFRYTEPQAFFVRESRTYNPTSSGSGGSGGSSGGSSGGGSSGGSSGGGGGHRF